MTLNLNVESSSEYDTDSSEHELNDSRDDADDEDETKKPTGNPKLADSLAKVLKMAKQNSEKKTVVFSKAKLENRNKLERKPLGFEVVTDPNAKEVTKVEDIKSEDEDKKDIKPNDKELQRFKRLNKQDQISRGRIKPSLHDREKEKPLIKIATKGVVQLFNAVNQQKVNLQKKFKEVGYLEVKKDKILKSIDKSSFLDILKGIKTTKEGDINNTEEYTKMKKEAEKNEVEDEEPTWQVLRDDFMMGTKLKDWDKQKVENTDPPAKKSKKS